MARDGRTGQPGAHGDGRRHGNWGWMSGAIYDLTGSYPTAFLNGIAKDLLNITPQGIAKNMLQTQWNTCYTVLPTRAKWKDASR
jgi:hypothetical protein